MNTRRSGVLTVEKVVYDRDGGFNREYSVHYEFQADSPDAPQPKRSETKLSEGQVSKAGVQPGRKFRTKVSYKVAGTCAPGPYVGDVESWQIVR